MNQEMPVFDINTIPSDFNPLVGNTLDNRSNDALYKDDGKLFVQFKTEAVLNPSASTKAGRPIYDDVDMIIIRTPGSQLTSIVAPVKYYMDRFGARYREWKTSQAAAVTGTPLENFPFLFSKPSLIAELKYRNIVTVEQLATIPDTAKQVIMGGHELSRLAAQWIDKTAADAEIAEKQELVSTIAALQAQVATLLADKASKNEAGAAKKV